MSKLKSFLRKSKEFLENYQNKNHNFTSTTINIVMGNQACDADSMISSLCYAYYKDMMMNNNHDHANIHYLPIMSISREDIYFRREVKILLELIDVSFDDLICVNECPFENFYQENLLKLTLMDHNYLASQLHSRYSSAVTEIVDHHADQGHYPSVEGVNRLIAFNSQISKAEVGSACTLVAERISQANLIDSTIATLLLGVISVDTMNMNPSVGIGTERDHHMIQLLQPFALMRLDELFPLLYNCKFDPQFWEELSVSNCLRFDYKLFDSPICNVGIASILIPLTNPSFILKSQLEMHCKQFMNSNQLKILVILSFSPFPNPQREFMVISESKTDVENLINTLNRDNETFLELAHIISENVCIVENNFANSGLFCQILSQGNIKASRKVISPHIIRFQKMLEETVSICGR